MDKHIIITIKVVLTALVIFLALFLLVKLAPIFAIIFIALFIVLALEPAVLYFKSKTLFKRQIQRGLAVSATFILFVLAIVFILTIGLPPVITQAQKLLRNLSNVFGGISGFEDVNISLRSLIPQISNLSGGIMDTTFSVFSNMLAVVSVLFLSLYMSFDWENIKDRFFELFSKKTREIVAATVHEIEENIGYWVKGQLLLMGAVGALSFFGLLIIGIDYPLALGLVAGLLEIVPVLGPVITAVLAALVGFAASPFEGFAAIVLFIIIQQLENNFLVPKIMQKVSGFSPLVILLALLIGSNLFGAVGAVVAVPLTMILVVIVRRVLRYSS